LRLPGAASFHLHGPMNRMRGSYRCWLLTAKIVKCYQLLAHFLDLSLRPTHLVVIVGFYAFF
jgi:hypothetical protein